jgi:hypothetical protein
VGEPTLVFVDARGGCSYFMNPADAREVRQVTAGVLANLIDTIPVSGAMTFKRASKHVGKVLNVIALRS